jgi:hypothetical protein
MSVKAVKFGSNTYLHRNGGLANFPASSSTGMVSFWYKIALSAAQKKSLQNNGSLCILSMRGVNAAGFGVRMFVFINGWGGSYPYLACSLINEMVNAANSHSVTITWNSNALTLNSAWHNAIIAWDTQAYSANAIAGWVDGVQLTNPPIRLADIGGNALPGYPFSNVGYNCTGGPFSMEFNNTEAWAIGANIYDNQVVPSFVDSYYTGALAEVYLNANPASYIGDMGNPTNRDKFRAGGYAQDIGGISAFYPYNIDPGIYLTARTSSGTANFVRNIPDKIREFGATNYNNQFTTIGTALSAAPTDPFDPGLIV